MSGRYGPCIPLLRSNWLLSHFSEETAHQPAGRGLRSISDKVQLVTVAEGCNVAIPGPFTGVPVHVNEQQVATLKILHWPRVPLYYQPQP